MLEIKNASISAGGRRLIEGLSFVANDSDTLCVVGGKGVGKTTLLKALMGLHLLDEGHVSIDGELLSAASSVEFRRLIISYVPQSPAMDVDTLGDLATILFSLEANKGKALPRASLFDEWEALGLGQDTYSRHLSEMPVGERQMALLGIVCMQNKPIVLADEPAAGLGVEQSSLVASYIRRRTERGQTVIVTTRDYAFAERVATAHNRITLKP